MKTQLLRADHYFNYSIVDKLSTQFKIGNCEQFENYDNNVAFTV